jgi:hypothetical protein
MFDTRLGLRDVRGKMKTKLITGLCVALVLGMATPCLASNDEGSLNAIADVTVVRPGCFVATVIGSAFFVVALPFAAISKSVKKTANTLVVKPAKATFTRPVGDMDALTDF